MSEFSSHVPDLDLITYYSEKGDSVFNKASPWTKAILLVLVIVFITMAKSLIAVTLIYVATLAVYAAAGLPVRKLFAWYALPLLFVLSLVLVLVWSQPGAALFSLGPLTLTDRGLIMVVTLLLKALASVTYSLFFLMTTKYNYFSAIIYRIFPSPVDQIFLMSYRFIFITLKMVDNMLKALRSRGGGIVKSARTQGRMFAEVFALTLIRSYDRAERVNKAMEARGFSGKYEATTRIPGVTMVEMAAMAAIVLLMIYVLWFANLPM